MFLFFRLIVSPHPIHIQKAQAARSAANRIQQKVIHVKASHLGHQLNRLHHKAEFKAQKRGEKK